MNLKVTVFDLSVWESWRKSSELEPNEKSKQSITKIR